MAAIIVAVPPGLLRTHPSARNQPSVDTFANAQPVPRTVVRLLLVSL